MRSLLFVPGDSRKKLDKGLASGADALILDLEDSVAFDRKREARATTLSFLAAAGGLATRPPLLVRGNGVVNRLARAPLPALIGGPPRPRALAQAGRRPPPRPPH